MNSTPLLHVHPAGRPSRTVMVVDGPGAIRELFESIIEPGHYDVVTVESGDRAYSLIKRVRPDLVILCLGLHDTSSLQVLSMLRLDPDTQDIPVITYPVGDDDLPRMDDAVDVPDDDFWRQAPGLPVRMH